MANIVLDPTQLDSVNWSKFNTTILADTEADEDGDLVADTVVETVDGVGSPTQHAVFQTINGLIPGRMYRIGASMKPVAARPIAYITFNGFGTAENGYKVLRSTIYFDLILGTICDVSVDSGQVRDIVLAPSTNGFFNVEFHMRASTVVPLDPPTSFLPESSSAFFIIGASPTTNILYEGVGAPMLIVAESYIEAVA